MINANELMVGNLVTELRNSRIVSIDGIEPNQEFFWANYLNGFGQYKVGINNIQPIPLTPEILEKCGFRESKKQPVHFTNLENPAKQLELLKSGEYFYPAIYQAAEVSSENDAMVYINRIQYIHQLQNLYFALTGEELNYTL